MRLLELTIQNYRVHRDLAISFDHHRNLIAGPNEAGKSTVMEAIQRVLFLPAKGNTKLHKAMRPGSGGGITEVVLKFETGAETYRLEKRYAGTNGRARLTSIGGITLTDQAAEEKLQALLGEPAGKAESAWAHIFVEQGRSADDPTGFANAYRQDLVARFQASGGAIVQQSARDAAVSARLSARVNDWFTQAGKARAGSPVAEADAAVLTATQALHDAAARFAQRESAAGRHNEASARIESVQAEQRQLAQELTEARNSAFTIETLRSALTEQTRALDDAGRAYDRALEADTEIATVRTGLEQRRRELAPLAAAEGAAKEALNERQRQARAAKDAWQAAAKTASAARAEREWRVTAHELAHNRQTQADIKLRLQRVATLEQQITAKRQAIAELAQVTREEAARLREQEDQCGRAQAAIDAISARLSIVEAGQPVYFGARLLEPGAVEVFAEETEIRIGENVRLALTPGGGTDLQQAARRLAELSRARDDLRARIGVSSAGAAFEAAERCERARAELRQLLARLEDAGGEALRGEAQQLAEQETALEARLSHQMQGIEGAQLPASIVAAQAAALYAEQARDEAQASEADLAVRLELAEQAVKQAQEAADAARMHAGDAAAKVSAGEQKLAWLLDQYGEDDVRQRALVDLRAARDQHAQGLEATKASLEGLQPELVHQDILRLERAIQAQEDALQKARAELNQAFGALGADGVSDLEADLLRTRAAFERAQARATAEHLRADALRRLHDLFSDKQRLLAEQYTGPLVAKATEYLRPILGPTTVMQLALEGSEFKELQVYRADRADTAFSFEVLSGGTREQVAAALRLAIAEVLAADHDGCLPVVFDDAFTNSDPERIRQLQRMLDLAATRGLQVIVLTCNPRDYSGFGAREISLERAARPIGAAHEDGDAEAFDQIETIRVLDA
jgi:DNA repair exonuclease SbcCD ATPase subunit